MHYKKVDSSKRPVLVRSAIFRKSSQAVVFVLSKQRTRELGRNVKFEPAFPIEEVGPTKSALSLYYL